MEFVKPQIQTFLVFIGVHWFIGIIEEEKSGDSLGQLISILGYKLQGEGKQKVWMKSILSFLFFLISSLNSIFKDVSWKQEHG